MMGACQRTQDQVRSKSGHFGTKITEPWKKWQPQVLIKSQHVSGGGSCYGGVVCGTVAHSGGRGEMQGREAQQAHLPRPATGRQNKPSPKQGCTRDSGWLLTSEDLRKSANGDKANHPPHGDPGAPSLAAAPLFSGEQLKENSRHSRFAGSSHLTRVLTQKWECAGLGGSDTSPIW